MKIKRMVSLMLCGMLLVAGLGGCGKEPVLADGETVDSKSTQIEGGMDASGSMGRFMESEVALPENVSDILYAALLADGSIELFARNSDNDSYQVQVSKDGGESFSALAIDAGQIDEIFNAYIFSSAIRSDGTVVGLMPGKDNTGSIMAGIIRPDGSMEKKELVIPDVESQNQEYAAMPMDCAFDAAGNLIIENLNSYFYRADIESGTCELLTDLEEKHVRHFGIAGNQVLAVAEDGISIVNSADGTAWEADGLLDEMMAADITLADKNGEYARPLVFTGGDSEDMIFYVNHQGLFGHARGSSINEQLINGALCTIGDTSAGFLNLMMVDERQFYLAIIDGTVAGKLLKYVYDENVPTMPEKELKIYALKDTTFLRQAVSSYQKNHQDVFVNLQIGRSGEDGVTAQDAIRALNTEILAGNGPDVLILDGLPVESYIEKGMLKDISAVVEEIDGSEGVFGNVKQAYQKDGAIYQFPARFYVSLVNGDEEALAAGASLEKLADYVTAQKAAGESKIFPMGGAAKLLEKLYYADSAGWFDESGKLKEEAIEQYLSCAKQIYDAQPNESEAVDYYSPEIDASLFGTLDAFSVVMKEAKLGYGTLVDISELVMLHSMNEVHGWSFSPANVDVVKGFGVYQLAGILAGTDVGEQAEDFLRTLFGAECGTLSYNGFPVNRAAYEALCEQEKHAYDGNEGNAGVSVSTPEGERYNLLFQNLSDEVTEKITGILEAAQKPVCMDEVIKEIVLEQGEKALKGEIAVDEALHEIMQKCNLYLSE